MYLDYILRLTFPQARFWVSRCTLFFFKSYQRICLLILERGEGRGEEHWCERATSTSCLLDEAQLGTEPATKVCALTGNRTGTFPFKGCHSHGVSPLDTVTCQSGRLAASLREGRVTALANQNFSFLQLLPWWLRC